MGHYINTSLENIVEEYNGKSYAEEWKDVIGYEGSYMVSNMGRIKSLKREVPHGRSGFITMPLRILKQKIRKDGYTEVNLAKDGVHSMNSIHILVAKHFIRNDFNLREVNHKMGVKTDSRFHQLEWVTPSQNQLHSFRVLNRAKADTRGSLNPNYSIFLNILTGIYYTYNELAIYFGVGIGRVRAMVSNRDKRVLIFVKT